MILLRPSKDRGKTKLDWLDSNHTFSFGGYYDPEWDQFKSLRVINEDIVAPERGFQPHSHKDMEIITYIIKGQLQHKDSTGSGSIIHPGDIQKMSAGTGIIHSEFNPSSHESVHFLQMWIIPDKKELIPGWEQKTFSDHDKEDKLLLIASKDGREGSITIHQDVNLYRSCLKATEEFYYSVLKERGCWVQVVHGEIQINGYSLAAGDGAQIIDESKIHITSIQSSEFLLFDLK